MISNKDFNHSFWEINTFFPVYDLIIIGSGIVGLTTAITYQKKNKKAKILVVERGILPDGASTKNAGFACFGSAGEILSDLSTQSENSVWETLNMRWKGLQLLRNLVGDKNMNYEKFGGYELFMSEAKFNFCLDKLTYLNTQLYQSNGLKNCYSKFKISNLPFAKIIGCIQNKYEGQIDTGLMMQNLSFMARKNGIQILNNVSVHNYIETSKGVELLSNFGLLKSHKLVIATNGFANDLVKIQEVKPARAQVLITHPLPKLNFKGSFHFDEGFFYFRNVGNRVLLGGGRNLEIENETTDKQGLNPRIQSHLKGLLKDIVLPKIPFKIEYQWSGIMGIGQEKKPIIKSIGKHTVIAVRMGGMGIAIGTLVGMQAAELIQD